MLPPKVTLCVNVFVCALGVLSYVSVCVMHVRVSVGVCQDNIIEISTFYLNYQLISSKKLINIK